MGQNDWGTIVNGRFVLKGGTLWRAAQHQYKAIAQRVGQRPAPHVVGATAATPIVAIRRTLTRPTRRLAAVGVGA